MFHVPAHRIDPAVLPPPLLTSEPGSFARDTLQRRVPAILRETLAENPDFDADVVGRLEELHAELTGGRIRELREDAADVSFWNTVSAPYFGRSWLDVPWYWAEAYFYRRILEATGYFRPGPWQGFDPYGARKRTEWAPDAAPRAVEALLSALPRDPRERFERLLHASLWGNRTDLSYMVAAHLGGTADSHLERSNLLADDTALVWDHLRSPQVPGGARPVAIIADNAGTEVLMDLALVDFLLTEGMATKVHLHLKGQPFFVSDAMPQDVMEGIASLPAGGRAARDLAARVREHLRDGRLVLTTHWFYATCLFHFQMPDDLRAGLARMRLVILKGDVNYRRLLGDAHWPPTTPFAPAVGYFPAPLVALRTLKAELIVGLAPGEAERLSAADPAWRVNGRRGVIQAALGPR